MSTDRREFLGTLLAAGALPLVGQAGTAGGGPADQQLARLVRGELRSSPMVGGVDFGASVRRADWDVAWAEKLNGKHRAVFDNVELSMGLGLLRALIWMKDYAEVYQTPAADMNAVVVLRHNAIWMIMDDEFWAHHNIGALTKINDPKTKLPIKRNPVLGPNVVGLPAALADDALRKVLSSATVLACNLAFTLDVVDKVKTDMKLDDAKAHEMALKHVIPGVTLQPSGVFAVLRAQEAGCRYLLATDA
jgi:hypothetical protein